MNLLDQGEQFSDLLGKRRILRTILVGQGDSPSRVVASRETQEKLRQALDDLPEIDREVLVLRHFEHLSRDEAAEALGIQVETVKKRYFRALRRLKQTLPDLELM